MIGQPKGRSLLGHELCPKISETNPMSEWVLRTNQKVTVGHKNLTGSSKIHLIALNATLCH